VQQYLCHFHPVKDHQGKIFGAALSLSNRTHQYQQQLRLSEKNRILGQIAKICSEDWPIPLINIRNMEEEISRNPELAQSVLPQLLNEALRLDGMIHEVNSMIAQASFNESV
jgi:hypothetical protein